MQAKIYTHIKRSPFLDAHKEIKWQYLILIARKGLFIIFNVFLDVKSNSETRLAIVHLSDLC